MSDRAQFQINVLNSHRVAIISDLDVKHIRLELISKFVLDHDDIQRIDFEKTTGDQANLLLDLMIKKIRENEDFSYFNKFVNSLQAKYSWLYELLDRSEDSLDARPTLEAEESSYYSSSNSNSPPGLIIGPSKRDKSKEILVSGGVPCFPTTNVERTFLIGKIVTGIQTLEQDGYFVLQGMTGCGKTVCAAQAVNKYVASNLGAQKDGIYWISVGKDCESKDLTLGKIKILCDKLGLTKVPSSLDHGADLLRNAFINRPNALLILDDVWHPIVIRSFDVGCKTLVTTRDISVMEVVNGRMKKIDILNGFTEEESKELFSRNLEMDIEELPEEALKIHVECKGNPMVVSLISALIKEHDNKDVERWAFYFDFLNKRKYSELKKIRYYGHESVIDAISLSIDKLPVAEKVLFEDFGVFQDDVRIPCEVLRILWDKKNKYEVEHIMKTFVKKSLVQEEHDPIRKSSVYLVHDLHLDYLKYQFKNDPDHDVEQRLHEKLVNKYAAACNYEFSKLPNDGYIYTYIGRHLYKSKKTDIFPILFTDLLFIGEKLRNTGVEDLIYDIQNYYKYIVENDKDRSFLIEEIQLFAQRVGHQIYNQADVDIIQLALQYTDLNLVYCKARELALTFPKRLYLEYTNIDANEWKKPESTIICQDIVKSVQFIGDDEGRYCLAALSSGLIQLGDISTSTIRHNYWGHKDSVNCLKVYKSRQMEKHIFLSAASDNICKIWDLKGVLKELGIPNGDPNGSFEEHSYSSSKFKSATKDKDQSLVSFDLHSAPVSYAEFSSTGNKVISVSDNEIYIWNSMDGSAIEKISNNYISNSASALKVCHFGFENDEYLIGHGDNQIALLSLNQPQQKFSIIEGHRMKILSVLPLNSEEFISVSEDEIGFWFVMNRRLNKKHNHRNNRGRVEDQSPTEEQIPGEMLFVHQNGNGMNGSGEIDNHQDISLKIQSNCYGIQWKVVTEVECEKSKIKIKRLDIRKKEPPGLYMCGVLSPNGKMLAVGTNDFLIYLWEVETKSLLYRFKCHNGSVTCLHFSDDEYSLMSGSEDRTIMAWDVEEEQKRQKEPLKKPNFDSVNVESQVNGLFKNYFVSIFITDKNSIQVYRDNSKFIKTVPVNSPITFVVLSKNGKRAVIGTYDGNVYRVRDMGVLHDNRRSPESNLGKINSIEVHFDKIATHETEITSLAFDETGKFLVSSSMDGLVMLFNEFQCKSRNVFLRIPIFKIYFLFGSTLIAIVYTDSSVKIFNIRKNEQQNGYLIKKDSDNTKKVTCSALSSDSSQLAIGTNGDEISVFDIGEAEGIKIQRVIICQHNVTLSALDFNFNGSMLAVGHSNGLITIWKIPPNQEKVCTQECDFLLHNNKIWNLSFSPESVNEGRWLLSCGDRLTLWCLPEMKEERLKPTFMQVRRRRKSGETKKSESRFSLEISEGKKIGRKGKREMLQSIKFQANSIQKVVANSTFTQFVTVDDMGIFYILQAIDEVKV